MSDSMSAIEYENMEQKYFETRSKLKKAQQYNERYNIQIQKLNRKLKRLETENKRLESQITQLETKAHDPSESDSSSQTHLQQEHTNMMDLVHTKNQQITDLLRDIEDLENENMILKDKLTEAKEQLSTATREITSMTLTLREKQELLKEQDDVVQKLTIECEHLRKEWEGFQKENSEMKEKMLDLSNKFKAEELELKNALDEKDKQIEKLKSALQYQSEQSSLASITKNISQSEKDKHGQVLEEKLKAVLSETESYLAILKSEMHQCTVDLKESAQVIKKLKGERASLGSKIETMQEKETDLVQQVRKCQERCQAMQREVEFANKLTKMFEADLSSIKNQMKDSGQLETVINIDEIQSLKIEKLLHEKQIVSLVKDINKLQEMFNLLEIENKSLRSELGLSPQNTIDIDPRMLTESKKQIKLIEKLQLENRNLQEERVKLKMEIKSFKKQIALVNLEYQDTKINEDLTKNHSIQGDRSVDVKALSEENEALRKGLHEILNSVQVRNETSPRELKSDVLQRLLKALDVKHISGWYHPAMRIQAELHSLEGVNSELREQLHEARNELDKLKLNSSFSKDPPLPEESSKEDINPDTFHPEISFEGILDNNVCLEYIKIGILKIFVHLVEGDLNVASALENLFNYLKKHIDLLHLKCNTDKEEVLEKLRVAEKAVTEFESLVLDANATTENLKQEITLERKKSNYLLKQNSNFQDDLAKVKVTFDAALKRHSVYAENLLRKIVHLNIQQNLKNNQDVTLMDSNTFRELQNSLNEYIRKYRQILTEIEIQQSRHDSEQEVFKLKESDLIKEINELKDKLNKSLNKSIQELYRYDANVLPLSEKVAKLEIDALSQKNRADHTNNLYELIKEQLKKSEEKFIEFSKYGDGLLQKNMVLQERIVQLEDQVILGVSPELYKELGEKANCLIKENEELLKENAIIQEKILKHTELSYQGVRWNKEKEQELLGLKHEIIDLTATSDDKAVIDSLYCDLTKSRSEVREYQMQLEFLRREVSNWEGRYAKLCSEIEGQRNHFDIQRKVFIEKIRTLQDVVLKQRIQYHGCAPLTLQEHFVEKLQLARKRSFKDQENQSQAQGNAGEQQIEYLKSKLNAQDKDIEKLEKELFSAYKLMDFHKVGSVDVTPSRKKIPILVKELVVQESLEPVVINQVTEFKNESKVVILRNVESQTLPRIEAHQDCELTAVKVQLNNLQEQITVKDNQISETIRFISEKEKALAETKEQLKRAEEQIASLERAIKEVHDRTKVLNDDPVVEGGGDVAGPRNNFLNEQIVALQVSIKNAQDRLKQKDSEIIKYQTLLKEDRDKHSLAATNLQKELVVLRKALTNEQQNSKSLEQECVISRQKSAAVENYITQVRALENHLAELHTQLAQSKVQLQNAHQESSRWRQMAQDRLIAMQELGKSLNDQHNKELSSYKTDYEKLRELSEEEPVKKINYKIQIPGFIDPEVAKLCREKDQRIDELVAKLKQLESGETQINNISSLKEKSTSGRELSILRGKYDAMLIKEKTLKEEIRDLREQVSKRTNLSVRTQKSDRSVKEQLQKRISSLEREVDTLNGKLTQEQFINEKHKLSAQEDFDKWKKQKYWQENSQKYKIKLQEREEELQKLQQTCIGYRMLIERLEREKNSLENRIKALKCDHKTLIPSQEILSLKADNEKLSYQLVALQAKMDIRQQGAGALSTAVMQDKLEVQERKIAVLELSSKGSVELRNELERLQSILAVSQKTNLCLEAENLELKLTVEKYSKETPRLEEQILHLESYIELLKNENEKQTTTTNNIAQVAEISEDKKVAQLERTVYVLKRVVEKLQVENKRLLSGKNPLSERSASADKLRRDYLRLKDQYTESLQKIKDLEAQLQVAKKLQRKQSGKEVVELLHSQLEEIKGQLAHKSQLLEKVKALLHTAAVREKQLLVELDELKASNMERDYQIDIPSTIEEVSEVNSDT
ncbi:centrosomal protein of 290 kDa [Euwallacea similis]|uniref:centrosomal protein of 290 kDa n=1 Tax=Euwallacea similis TaxID=1736056 RepID=UPI00344D0A65